MVNVIKDERTWKIYPELENHECPFLYYPANIHGCEYDDQRHYEGKECNMDSCPIREMANYRKELSQLIQALERAKLFPIKER